MNYSYKKPLLMNTEYIEDQHPFRLIPALEDDGFKIFEFRAICKYLLAKYGKGHELHNDAQGSAAEIGAYEQALSIEYSYFQPTILGLAYEIMFKKWVIVVITLFFQVSEKD